MRTGVWRYCGILGSGGCERRIKRRLKRSNGLNAAGGISIFLENLFYALFTPIAACSASCVLFVAAADHQ
jgi:hypothetical protein